MTDKICPECGTKQDESFTFCKNCGAVLSDENNSSDDVKVCPECGNHEERSSKFCKNCGFQFSNENQNGTGKGSTTRCGNCGAELNDEMYCPDCGEPTGIKICPNCMQKTVNEDFCSFCGYKINKSVKNCHNCGSKMDVNAKVCANCGAKVIHKNPLAALVLSLLFPGLGQLYNNQNRKAITLFVGYIISFILCLILVGVILALAIWVYGMYDAFTSAKAINNGESLEDRIF